MDKESEKYSKLDQLSKADLEMLSQNNSKNSKNSKSVSISVELKMDDKESYKSKEESKAEESKGEESKPSSSPSHIEESKNRDESQKSCEDASSNHVIANRSHGQENQLKDTQFNHSKLLRQIEVLLKDLEMDFNEGVIIKMNLEEKISLRDKIELVIKNQTEMRNQAQSSNKAISSLKHNLSETNVSLGKKPVDKIQEMRAQHYKMKSLLKKNQKLSNLGHSNKKFSKMNAYEVDYDFYFKNNQGFFVVQSQINYVDLKKIKRKVKIDKMMKDFPNYKETQ